jgi:hypothetical protein
LEKLIWWHEREADFHEKMGDRQPYVEAHKGAAAELRRLARENYDLKHSPCEVAPAADATAGGQSPTPADRDCASKCWTALKNSEPPQPIGHIIAAHTTRVVQAATKKWADLCDRASANETAATKRAERAEADLVDALAERDEALKRETACEENCAAQLFEKEAAHAAMTKERDIFRDGEKLVTEACCRINADLEVMTKDRDAQQATKVKLIEDNLAQTAIVEKLRAACNQLVTAMVQLDKEHHREVAFAREALTADAKGGEKK